jgi:hypothetical protein
MDKKMWLKGETPLKVVKQIPQQRLLINKTGGYFAPIT